MKEYLLINSLKGKKDLLDLQECVQARCINLVLVGLNQIYQRHDEEALEQEVVFLRQSHKRLQHIVTGLFGVQAWVALADEESTVKRLLEEAERVQACPLELKNLFG